MVNAEACPPRAHALLASSRERCGKVILFDLPIAFAEHQPQRILRRETPNRRSVASRMSKNPWRSSCPGADAR